jgi:hypothetical protein
VRGLAGHICKNFVPIEGEHAVSQQETASV